jgi:hypothetical protein
MNNFSDSYRKCHNWLHKMPASGCLALFLTFLTIPGQAQDFGTLFTSPDEREYLDYLRAELVRTRQLESFDIEEDFIPEIPVAEEVVETSRPEISEYKFGGIMVRINGSRMVWLNGRQVSESELPGNMTLLDSASGMMLNIRTDAGNFRLKPGQVFNVLSGTVSDSYQVSPPSAQAPRAANPETTVAAAPVTEVPSPETDSANLAEPADPADLAAALEQIGAGEEGFSEEQLQQALDILIQQANAEE